jgi:hypothetical protein
MFSANFRRALRAAFLLFISGGATQAGAASVISGLTYSVNNSETGTYFWSTPSTSDCVADAGGISGGCAEVGGGYIVFPETKYENKRGMSEFNLAGQTLASQATLSFEVYNQWGYYIQGEFVNADVVVYQGNNVGELGDWGASSTASLGSFSTGDFCNWSYSLPCNTITFDVTVAYNQAIINGWSALGIRLQDPNLSPSEASIFHHFSIEATTVPLPGAVWLFGAGLAFLASVGTKCRRIVASQLPINPRQ